MQAIELKFRGVHEIQQKFNAKIFDIIKRHYNLARASPIDIVRVMRIVKNEEVATKAAQKEQKVAERKSIMIDSDDEKSELITERRPGFQVAKLKQTETLQSLCEQKLRETVMERADLAFMDIPYRFHSQEDLSIALDQCKNLFLDLRYVS